MFVRGGRLSELFSNQDYALKFTFIYVENGNCYREYREGREYHLYTIESLTAKSFETEHPYMSLMLN